MLELKQCILVTNNDRAANRWDGEMKQVILLDTYEAVLLKSRDLIHSGCGLVTHPQASSLKPNQTPFRSIVLCGESVSEPVTDILLIEKAIEVYYKWDSIHKTPGYDEKTANDYKTIDLSMIENVVPKL